MKFKHARIVVTIEGLAANEKVETFCDRRIIVPENITTDEILKEAEHAITAQRIKQTEMRPYMKMEREPT